MTEKEVHEKLMKVIYSCETKEQIKSAWEYYKLWGKKYFYKERPYSCWTDGKALGAFNILSRIYFNQQKQ